MGGLASTVPANRPQQTNRRCTDPDRCTPIPGPSPLREKGAHMLDQVAASGRRRGAELLVGTDDIAAHGPAVDLVRSIDQAL